MVLERGASAQLFSSSAVTTPCRATISGTGGWISLEPPFFTPTTMLVGTGGDVRRVEIEPAGYVPQVEEVGRCLRAACWRARWSRRPRPSRSSSCWTTCAPSWA